MRQPKMINLNGDEERVLEETWSKGREPGRSKADRLQWFARRGRFSPSPENAASMIRRGVLFACGMFALVVIAGSANPSFAAAKSKKAQKISQTKQSVNKPAGNSSRRDYKSKFKPKPPPPRDDRRPRKVTKQPKQRPIKQPRQNPVIDPGYQYPRPDPPVLIMHEWIGPADYPAVPDEFTFEAANIVLTTTAMVFNVAVISIGERTPYLAAAGFLFGATSLVIASRETTRHSGLHYLLGAASIALSVWNLSGGVQPTGPPDEYGVYDTTALSTYSSTAQSIGFSYTF
ncbi:MAG: hypothetical protein KAJ17_07425 [Candidatus Krumholzibacteria bacterium]|nr:hypothetical protein [Candidatus Krumholzibacteria bacterium]